MPRCYICECHVGGISDVRRHLKHVHKIEEHSVHKCGEPNCFQTCSNWQKFRKHLKSFHNFLINSNDGPPLICKPVGTADEVQRTDESCDYLDCSTLIDSSCKSGSVADENLEEQIETFASRLVGKLYSKPGYPRKLVQDFIDDTSDLSTTMSLIEVKVKQELESSNVDPGVTNNITAKLNTMKDPFSGLNSEYQRLEYMKKKGFYIEPRDYKIASDMLTKVVNGKVILELNHVKGKYIPLREVFKLFLELPNVFNVVTQSLQKPACTRIISEFVHGFHWLSKKRLFHDKLVIPLFLCYDDYEVDKDIGPHSAKLGAVYVKLACLPNEYQGVLENIFLALLFSYEDRVDYGNKQTFQKLTEELNFLQSTGIDVNLGNGNLQKVYFSIGLLVGDNLALHTLLGFTESFSANFSCRLCHVDKSLLHIQCVEDPSLMRDEVQHAINIQTDDVSKTGVKLSSVMEGVEYYKVTENPGVDIMHDVFEGACIYDMQHILYYLIFERQFFDVNTLNFRLLTFNYSADIVNRPSQFKEKSIKCKSIKMTASEMRVFVRIFALLVGDLVPEGDEVWSLYLVLRDIIEILLSRHVQEEVCTILKTKISEHHRLYVHLFKDSLKPKHHFMVDYPSIMKQSGCLANFSCDRFEANHQPSIRDAKGTNSRRNIAHTLAVKEQLRCAYRFMSFKGLYPKLEVGCEENPDQFNSAMLPDSFQSVFTQHSYANVKGTVYKKGICVVSDIDEDGGPEFGCISAVVINVSGEVCLVCDMLTNLSFDDHFHAFRVKDSGKKKSLLVSSLLDPTPVLCCRSCNGHLYVTLYRAL